MLAFERSGIDGSGGYRSPGVIRAPELREAAAGTRMCGGAADARPCAGAGGVARKRRREAAGMDRQTLRDWVHRYNAEGLAGLHDRISARPRSTHGAAAGRAGRRRRARAGPRGTAWCAGAGSTSAPIEARFAVRLHERSVGKVLAGSATAAVGQAEAPEGRRGGPGGVQKSFAELVRRCPSTPAASRSRSGSRMRPASASRAR